jgi:ribosome-associated protein
VDVDIRGVRYTFARSGGPGGQHANTSATKATVTIDVAAALAPDIAARVVAACGNQIQVSDSSTRSQYRNRASALQRALDRIDMSIVAEPERKPTCLPHSAKLRRRKDKVVRSQRLASRNVDSE